MKNNLSNTIVEGKDKTFKRNQNNATLKKILHLNPPKHEFLNQLLIKSLNQPYYLVDSTKKFSQITLFSRFE